MKLRSLLVIWVLVGVSGARAQKVETHYEKGTDFSRLKTYAWRDRVLSTQQSQQNQELISRSLTDAVNAQLKAKGLTEVQDAPDFYLSFHGGSYVAEGKSGHSMTPQDVSGGGVWGKWSTDVLPGSIPNVWVAMQGAIRFDVIDAKTDGVVWDSILSKKIKKPGHMPENLDAVTAEIAQKAFRDFPPKTKSK